MIIYSTEAQITIIMRLGVRKREYVLCTNGLYCLDVGETKFYSTSKVIDSMNQHIHFHHSNI